MLNRVAIDIFKILRDCLNCYAFAVLSVEVQSREILSFLKGETKMDILSKTIIYKRTMIIIS